MFHQFKKTQLIQAAILAVFISLAMFLKALCMGPEELQGNYVPYAVAFGAVGFCLSLLERILPETKTKRAAAAILTAFCILLTVGTGTEVTHVLKDQSSTHDLIIYAVFLVIEATAALVFLLTGPWPILWQSQKEKKRLLFSRQKKRE